jgi:hypothetical protein
MKTYVAIQVGFPYGYFSIVLINEVGKQCMQISMSVKVIKSIHAEVFAGINWVPTNANAPVVPTVLIHFMILATPIFRLQQKSPSVHMIHISSPDGGPLFMCI